MNFSNAQDILSCAFVYKPRRSLSVQIQMHILRLYIINPVILSDGKKSPITQNKFDTCVRNHLCVCSADFHQILRALREAPLRLIQICYSERQQRISRAQSKLYNRLRLRHYPFVASRHFPKMKTFARPYAVIALPLDCVQPPIN